LSIQDEESQINGVEGPVAPTRLAPATAAAVVESQRRVATAAFEAAEDGPVTDEDRRQLAVKADRYARGGMILIGLAVILTIALLTATWIATGRHVRDLDATSHAMEMLVLLLARGTAFGGAGIALIIAVLLFARACLDQSARFRKRWFSAPVFNEAMRLYLARTEGQISTDDVIALFESWNKIVDSPFANIKLRAKPQNVSINASQGRVFIGEQAETEVKQKGKSP
jgi:hypothetical protein